MGRYCFSMIFFVGHMLNLPGTFIVRECARRASAERHGTTALSEFPRDTERAGSVARVTAYLQDTVHVFKKAQPIGYRPQR